MYFQHTSEELEHCKTGFGIGTSIEDEIYKLFNKF